MAFVVRPEQPDVAVVPLGPLKELAELIDRWRASHGAGKAPPIGCRGPRRGVAQAVVGAAGRAPARGEGGPGLPGRPAARACPGPPCPAPRREPSSSMSMPSPSSPSPSCCPSCSGPASPVGEPPSLLLAGGIAFGEEKARGTAARDDKLPPVPVFGPMAGTESEVNDLRSSSKTFPQGTGAAKC